MGRGIGVCGGGQRLVLELGGWARNMDSVEGSEFGTRRLGGEMEWKTIDKWLGDGYTSLDFRFGTFGSGLSVRDFG